ncbi:uncharacterized protein LOC135146171 [Zophobas morio]|uniref:uncharacterized protein LOC135146171 n=1 Tax=Zophobas morio TaxID=2755281 RepID=UPI003083A872
MCWMHWLTAPALIGTVGAVLYSQQLKGKERGNVLFLHKSLGLLTAFIAIPRIIGSLTSQHPESFKKGILGTAGKLNHLFLYIFLVVMPSSGILMGYFGGKGLPFFFTTLKGSEKPNESISKKSFWLHKNFGSYAKYLIPLHVGAVGFHLARGEAIFARINPFRKL